MTASVLRRSVGDLCDGVQRSGEITPWPFGLARFAERFHRLDCRELLPAQRRGFVPAAAGGIYALLGLIFVLQADGGMRAALRLALRLTLLVVSIRALCPAEENARLRPYAAAVCLLAGLVRVELPFGVPLAEVEGAAV